MTHEFTFGYPLVIDPFPETVIAFLFVSWEENWAWLSACLGHVGSCVCRHLTLWVGGSKVWLDRNVRCTPLATRALLAIVSSQGNCPRLSLLVISENGSGFCKDSIFCTLCGDACHTHGIFLHCQELLLFIQAETWQDIWKDFFE